MRRIKLSIQDEMLVLETPELDGYIYLPLENGKAVVSRLDDNTCKKTFDCSSEELKRYIKDRGY